ncbi:hypothetical protein MM817_01705 [Acidibacillus sp. S0AB]|uniref:Uncharacterized protein n=1 Tax=Sulfoacidibacillus ferrooxidans TaxID=2005001 RepID=A0A9X2ABT8_9BACL|nr:hypothetical protein [Sulfoacidibacillus ferrooxidans]
MERILTTFISYRPFVHVNVRFRMQTHSTKLRMILHWCKLDGQDR